MTIKLSECRVRTMVNVIRGKWKPIIIKALQTGNLGYGELRRVVPEPSQKVMTAHLRELEKDKIISRAVFAQKVVRVEYSLTEYGWSLIPVLRVMGDWGQKHRDLICGMDPTGSVLSLSSNARPLRQDAL